MANSAELLERDSVDHLHSDAKLTDGGDALAEIRKLAKEGDELLKLEESQENKNDSLSKPDPTKVEDPIHFIPTVINNSSGQLNTSTATTLNIDAAQQEIAGVMGKSEAVENKVSVQGSQNGTTTTSQVTTEKLEVSRSQQTGLEVGAEKTTTLTENQQSASPSIATQSNEKSSGGIFQKIGSALSTGWKVFQSVSDVLWFSAVTPVVRAFSSPENLVNAAKAVGGFLKQMSDSLGLTDIAMGCVSFGKGIFKLVTGNPKEAMSCFADSLRAVKGAFVALGEFTGISDIYRGVVCLCKGQWGQAALHLGLGAAGLVSLFTTAGVGNIMTTAAKTAAKVGMKTLAKGVSGEIVAGITKKLGKEVLEQVGSKVADVSLKEISKLTTAELTEKAVKDIVSKNATQAVKTMLEQVGAVDIVANSTKQLLYKIANSNRKDLAKHLISQGIKEGEAEFIARSLKKALGRAGTSSRHHKFLQQELIDEITENLTKDLMERGLKEGFEKTFKKGIQEIGVQRGLTKEAIENLTKAGAEGFDQGAKKAVREIVEAGVKKAFDEFSRSESRRKNKDKEEEKKPEQAKINEKKNAFMGDKKAKLDEDSGVVRKKTRVRNNRDAATGDFTNPQAAESEVDKVVAD